MKKRAQWFPMLFALAAGCSSTVTGTTNPATDAGVIQDVPSAPRDGASDVAPPDAPRVCRRHVDCASGERCVYVATSACGEDDTGTCRRIPGCELLPVAPQYCGCDGRTFAIPNECPPDRPFVSVGPCPERDAGTVSTATMLWQGPGGFAGTGPAVMVRGNGTVWTWREVTELTPTGPTPMPDATLSLSPMVVADLFARWDRVPLASLPHGPRVSSDCYPSVTVQRCATCMPVRLRYDGPAQLTPEMNEVWQWFAVNVPGTQPRTFCAF